MTQGFTLQAQIAQLVEQRTENPRVTGSIPVLGICNLHKGHDFQVSYGYNNNVAVYAKVIVSLQIHIEDGILAQVVEHLTFNQVVRGSSPRCLIKRNLIELGFIKKTP